MTKRVKKRHGTRKTYPLFKALSAVLVMSFLIVSTSLAIKKLSNMLNQASEGVSLGIASLLSQNKDVVTGEGSSKDVKFTLAIMADSEDDFENLHRALDKSVQLGVDYILFLGDYTSWGDSVSLIHAKSLMDGAGIPYYSVPGDHDLAASVQAGDLSGLREFSRIFGANFHSLSLDNTKIILMDNSANYTGLSDDLVTWFYTHLSDAEFVFLSQPLYQPNFNKVMGIVDGVEVPMVRSQALELLEKIRASNVQAIISAEQHIFSRHTDSVDSTLEHVVVGALNAERNLQTPRFCLLHLLEDGGYRLEEVVL